MTPKEEMLLQRVAKVLGQVPEHLKHFTLNDIIEQLTDKLEDKQFRSEKMALWNRWKGVSMVSQRTFIRRVFEYGWSAEMAARTAPAPTRPYDKEE